MKRALWTTLAMIAFGLTSAGAVYLTCSPKEPSWEDAADVGTLVVAMAALCTAIYTAYIQRQHNYMISQPLLDFDIMSNEKEKKGALRLRNYGLGPCIIKRYEIRARDGNNLTMFRRNSEYHEYVTSRLDKCTPGATFLREGSIIKQGTEILLTKMDFSATDDVFVAKTLSKVKDILESIEVEIDYTDLYGRVYLSKKLFSKTRPDVKSQ